ncbi:MAG: hypothetical protein JST68_21680 [Bacteroidetes bacterium]|nr:hypothetical protein [Bacteroidota bacterium]
MKSKNNAARISINSKIAAGSLLEKLAVDVLGAKNLLSDPGLRLYKLSDGTVLEVYGAGSFHSPKIFDKGNVVLSFLVKDVDLSARQMLSAGAQLLDGITRTCETFAYCHLLLDEGQIIGLHQID